MSDERLKPFKASPQTFGEFLVWFRRNRTWSQRELAELMEFSSIYVSQVENGQYELPKDLIRRIYQHTTNTESVVLDKIIIETFKLPPRSRGGRDQTRNNGRRPRPNGPNGLKRSTKRK